MQSSAAEKSEGFVLCCREVKVTVTSSNPTDETEGTKDAEVLFCALPDTAIMNTVSSGRLVWQQTVREGRGEVERPRKKPVRKVNGDHSSLLFCVVVYKFVVESSFRRCAWYLPTWVYGFIVECCSSQVNAP